MLRSWWNQRSKREQYITLAGSIIVVTLILDIFIWQPLTSTVTQMQQSVVQDNSLLTWMTDAKAKLNQWRDAGYTPTLQDSAGLLVTVEQTLTKTGLSRHLTNTTEQSTNAIDLTFTNVPFDEFSDWVEMLWVSNNIIVDKITVQKSTTIGLANVTLTLTKS